MKILEHYIPKSIPCEAQTETISVAVAIYNVDAYLERAVDSLLNQTYRNLEIILVDDGSTDNCPAICDRYAEQDERVKVIHKENGGLFTSRNVGIENATGTYMAFLDGDDWVDADMYEKLLAALKGNEADLAVCRYRWVYRDGTEDASTDMAAVMEGQEVLAKYLEEDDRFQIQNAAWNKLYKRSLLKELRFPPRLYEDMMFTIQLLARPERSVYLDRAYHNYVCDRNTSIMNLGINDRTFTDLIPNLYDRSVYLRQNGKEELALLQDYFLYKRLLLFYTQVSRSHNKKKKEYKKFLTQKLREGKPYYEEIFSIEKANPNEYRKMKIFLCSPLLYRVAMRLNDTVVIPIKTRRVKK